jgi:Glycosyltransferase family 87
MSVAAKADIGTPRRPLPQLIKGLLGIGILLGLELAIWLSMSGIRLAMRGQVDFRNLYTAGYMVRTGHARQLYDYHSELAFQNSLVSPQPRPMPYLRPAYQSLSLIPFSYLPYKGAYFAFLLFNSALLALSYRLLRPDLNFLAMVSKFLPAAIFLLFIPVVFSLLQGQDSLVFLTLMALAFVFLEHGHEGWAGLLVGLGIWKLQILAPLALLFLFWKRWRFLCGLSVTGMLCLAVSARLVGIAQMAVYFHTLMGIKAVADIRQLTQYQYAAVVPAMPSLRGLLFALLHSHASPAVLFVSQLLIALPVLVLIARLNRNTRRASDLFLIAITASCFVSYYLFVHDLSILVMPIVLAMDRCLAVGFSGDKYEAWVAPSAALMFAAPACAFFSPAHLYLVSIPLLVFLLTLAKGSSEPADSL